MFYYIFFLYYYKEKTSTLSLLLIGLCQDMVCLACAQFVLYHKSIESLKH